MPKKSGSGAGSLYFDNTKKKWIVQRYVTDYETGKSIRKIKVFSSEEEGKKYLSTLMYQKENSLYIKYNGLPINELMRVNLQKKLDMNLIKERQFTRTEQTIKVIEKSYISHKGQNNTDNQLFLSPKGNLVDPRNANVALKKILKNNFNITDITTHSLRHTYGTRCIEAGMRAVALQRLMGHTDIGITLNTYTSVFNKYKQTELNKVNDYYLNNSLLPNDLLELPKNEELEI